MMPPRLNIADWVEWFLSVLVIVAVFVAVIWYMVSRFWGTP